MLTFIKNNWLLNNQSVHCLLCGLRSQRTLPLCTRCEADLPWLTGHCRCCALPLPLSTAGPLLCPGCLKRPPPYQRICAAFQYRFPINQLIMRSKFNRQPVYLALLAQLLIRSLDLSDLPAMILPVPMHPARLRQRHYNQAYLLAKTVAQQLQLPLTTDLLRKTVLTDTQSALDAKARKRNLRNSFRCLQAPAHHVAVIDDVVTTGATATEITRVLKRAGCARVEIWAVARTGKHD